MPAWCTLWPMSPSAPRTAGHAATVRRLATASGPLSTAVVARMDSTLPWFSAMPADDRSWIGLVAQAGISALVDWLRTPEEGPRITGDVFATAPPELARAVTLQQVVELVSVAVDVVEEQLPDLVPAAEQPWVREAVLRYTREIAFAAARVYARAAEQRGAWDARLESMVVDVLARGDDDGTLVPRAAALGWSGTGTLAVLVGRSPAVDPTTVVDAVHGAAHHVGTDVLAGVHDNRLLVLVRTTADGTLDDRLLAAVVGCFGPGPVVVGSSVAGLAQAHVSAADAQAGLTAAPAWPDAPRPVRASDLLGERALIGDPRAHAALVEDVYIPLRDADLPLLDTVATYLECGGALEATSRMLFVHPNTVRYRLRKAGNLTGTNPADGRDSLVLRLALALGRIRDAAQAPPAPL